MTVTGGSKAHMSGACGGLGSWSFGDNVGGGTERSENEEGSVSRVNSFWFSCRTPRAGRRYCSDVTSAAGFPSAGTARWRTAPAGFAGGAAVGLLGGLVGLGSAEFRLPLLLGVFGFAALAAVIVNKAMSLVVVLAAIPARLAAVPLDDVVAQWPAVLNLLAGSLVGAWLGASWATRMAPATLYRVLSALLVFIAAVLTAERVGTLSSIGLAAPALLIAGLMAGFGIGVVAAIMGVAGGELLIPTLVLLFAVDARHAPGARP